MTKQLHEYYANDSVLVLRQEVAQLLSPSEQLELYKLLDVTVLKVLSKTLDASAKLQALTLARAELARFATWVNQQYPTTRLTITEALTRVLLSLTVETKI